MLGHRGVDLFELRNELVAAVGAPRARLRCAHGLEFLKRGTQVGEGDGVALQQQPEHVGRAGFRGCVHDGPPAVAATHRDETLGLEDPQRFAQRHQAHPELLDEHLLARQQVTIGKLALDDLSAKFVRDDLGRPGASRAGGEPRGQFPKWSYRQ